MSSDSDSTLILFVDNTPEPAASKRRKPTVRTSPRTSGRSTRGTRSARSMADLSDSEVESGGDDDSSKEVKMAKRNTRKGRAGKKRTRGALSLCLVRGDPFGGILIHLRFFSQRARRRSLLHQRELDRRRAESQSAFPT